MSEILALAAAIAEMEPHYAEGDPELDARHQEALSALLALSPETMDEALCLQAALIQIADSGDGEVIGVVAKRVLDFSKGQHSCLATTTAFIQAMVPPYLAVELERSNARYFADPN